VTTAPRKLATIVALDVAGYSARTEADEAKTTAEVAALRQVIEGIAESHGGRVFNTAGDGFMLEFGSSLAAVEAAGDLAAKCEPKVRVGVHLGDVVVQPNGDLLGHGVNVAARLMARSDPGAALISADVRRTIRGPLAERLVSRGPMQLDKMAETIEAFALAALPGLPSAAPAQPMEPVLAVLAFDNLSDDRDMQFFSDGVSEEILQAVSRAENVKVIGRSSSFQYRGADKAVRKVARELQATHVLDGSVRRAGQRIRVTAHLVEAAGQTTLWTDRFDRDLTDVLQVQDELATAIAQALGRKLVNQPMPHQIDPAAFDLYLKGRRVLAADWLESERNNAVALLERAVNIAPDFARAWGLLALARISLLPMERDTQGEPEHSAALAAANRAVHLDPNTAEAYLSLAHLKPAFSDHIEKFRLLSIASDLAPNDAFIHAFRAAVDMSAGWRSDCIQHFRRSIELEPSLTIFKAGLAAYLSGTGPEDDEAQAVLDDLKVKDPGSPLVWFIDLSRRLERGHLDQPQLAAIADLGSSFPMELLEKLKGLLTLRALPSEEIRRILLARLSKDASPVLDLALWHLLGRSVSTDLAYGVLFDALDAGRPIGNHGNGPWGLRRGEAAAVFFMTPGHMRADPRFARLCARLGLVELWMTTNHWPDCAAEVPYDFKAECEKAAREVSKA
jgi:adenylate cyclase